jgi:hypothetical protein
MRVLVVMLALAGCRFHFDETGTDAAINGSDIDASGDGAMLQCPASYVMLGTQSSRYLAIDNSVVWLTAEQMCEADGAHLVIIDDATEQSLVFQTLPAQNIWLGVTDRVAIGSFRKVTGGAATFLPWDGGEPDVAAAECVYMDSLTSRFADQDCASGRRAVCECDGAAADATSY